MPLSEISQGDQDVDAYLSGAVGRSLVSCSSAELHPSG